MDRVIPDDVLEGAVECVKRGGVLLYPTDTVYGLGGDARNEETSRRIRSLKGSDPTRPLLILTDDWDRVEDWIALPQGRTRDVMKVGTQHPITILFRATSRAPRSLIGASEEIGIRYCRHSYCRDVIRMSDRPLSSTSANRTGEPVAVRFDEIDPIVRDGSDFSVDGGRLDAVASTIVRVTDNEVEVVRKGSLPTPALEQLLI